jgi:hypothetical protein
MPQKHNKHDPCASESNGLRLVCLPNARGFFPLSVVNITVGLKKAGSTYDVVCELFEDSLTFVLCQRTHLGNTGAREGQQRGCSPIWIAHDRVKIADDSGRAPFQLATHDSDFHFPVLASHTDWLNHARLRRKRLTFLTFVALSQLGQIQYRDYEEAGLVPPGRLVTAWD